MSRWLGMMRREAQPAASPPCVGDDDVSLMAKQGRLGHRRKSSEETEQSSRRSSQQSQHDHNSDCMSISDPLAVALNEEAATYADTAAAAPADDDDGGTADGVESSPGTEHSSVEDWEILGEQGGIRRDGDEIERPVSPGVDFSSLYAYSNNAEEVEEGGEEGGETASKWLDAGEIHSFLVRGPTYLQTPSAIPDILESLTAEQDKEKLPAGNAMCRLVGFDCFTEDSPGTTRIDHIASRGSCRERVQCFMAGSGAPFLFIMNIQVRGTPTVSLVAYWAVDPKALEEATCAEASPTSDEAALDNGDDTCEPSEGIEAEDVGSEEHVSGEKAFFRIVASYSKLPVSSFGGDGCGMMDEEPPPPYSDERNTRFKLIPRVIGGPWMVRKAIGSTPVLLGTKISHRYYRGEGYVETDMDTGSSAAAASLCGRCRGLSRKIDVELGVVLQANEAQELPEALLGAVRLNGFGVEDPALQRKLYPS